MARNRQPDLFLSDPQSELLEDRPGHVYRADPDEVRRDLMRLLAQARAAETMPWEPRKVRLYRTIFPQMATWLPDDEAKQLCFAFETELLRLEAAQRPVRDAPHPKFADANFDLPTRGR